MKLTSKVSITKNPTTGLVFNLNENLGKDGKQYGFIRLEQTTVDMTSAVGGVKTRSALKSFTAEAFQKAEKFLTEGRELGGSIVRKETTDVNIHKNGEKSGYTVKRAGEGENAPVCKANGLPIFQATEYVEVENAEDTLVQHTNVDEIKAYQAAQKEAAALNA
jgi:hypothetical protein